MKFSNLHFQHVSPGSPSRGDMVTLLSAVTYCLKENGILVCMQVTKGSLYKSVRKVNKG